MKLQKNLLAAAVAGAMVVPTAQVAQAADVSVGTLISVSVANRDPDGPGAKDNTSMDSNQSSVWLKAKEDLGNGMSIIGFADFQFDPTTAADGPRGRDQYVGLQSDWGRVVFGTTSSSYKSSGKALDPWWRTAVQARASDQSQISRLHSGNGRHRGRVNNMIRYDSPSFNGAKAIAWVGLDDTSDDSHEYGFGIHYKAGNLFAAFDYWNGNFDTAADGAGVTGSDDGAYKFSAKWTQGNYAVWGAYEIDDGLISFTQGLGGTMAGTGDVDGADIIYVGGSYTMGNNMISVTYGTRDDSDIPATAGADDGVETFNISGRHALSKSTYVYAGYTDLDGDGPTIDQTMFTAGIRANLK